MSNGKMVYLNVSEITEVHTTDVFVKDVAKLYCSDPHLTHRLNSMKIRTVEKGKCKRYVESVLPMIQKMEAIDGAIQVCNVGQVMYIIDYQSPKAPRYWWQWIKTIGICVIAFCGAAFAIMTFNNDVSVGAVFKEVYLLIMGVESDGFTILELSYSVGLFIGIVGFFNHFAKWKVNSDPTPLEVEMRLYEDNISKTLIQNDGRKEQGIDVQ